MGDDHRMTKNKLQAEIRERIRDDFNHRLTSNIDETVLEIKAMVEAANLMHPRCKPMTCEYYEAKSFSKRRRTVYVHGLFAMSFLEVKGGDRG